MAFQYTPSPFMLPTSHYDKKKADRAVTFIQNLCHTKGKWAGQKFLLLPWQEQIVRDIFGIVRADGKRQFLTAYVEIPKKQGKSELAAAIALYLLYADGEASAEVYGAACDRNQASIVFDVAKQMVQMSPALMKRSKITAASRMRPRTTYCAKGEMFSRFIAFSTVPRINTPATTYEIFPMPPFRETPPKTQAEITISS